MNINERNDEYEYEYVMCRKGKEMGVNLKKNVLK